MRNFIVSDIHGNGNLYYSVMNYVENISKDDEATLYINGDLIDRGKDSAIILLDLIKRINDKDNHFNIVYLGGNHELLMYQTFRKRIRGLPVFFNDWYRNGGEVTDKGLEEILGDKDKILEVVDFIANLDLYHVFDEKIDDKNIILVHAASGISLEKIGNLKIKDNNRNVDYMVWTREDDYSFPFRVKIGNKDYFSIIGHTSNNSRFGFIYNKKENYLNIDGGSAPYVLGYEEYNHFPLVEVKDGYLKILTFNGNNDIIYGNYFKDYKRIPFSEEELNSERKKLKVKKL